MRPDVRLALLLAYSHCIRL